jgi:hypothetical protein
MGAKVEVGDRWLCKHDNIVRKITSIKKDKITLEKESGIVVKDATIMVDDFLAMVSFNGWEKLAK